MSVLGSGVSVPLACSVYLTRRSGAGAAFCQTGSGQFLATHRPERGAAGSARTAGRSGRQADGPAAPPPVPAAGHSAAAQGRHPRGSHHPDRGRVAFHAMLALFPAMIVVVSTYGLALPTGRPRCSGCWPTGSATPRLPHGYRCRPRPWSITSPRWSPSSASAHASRGSRPHVTPKFPGQSWEAGRLS
jgi:hypothetical protein